jgi:hypothetical protein
MIDIERITILEAKDDAPVSRHLDGVEALEITRQLVKAVACDVHIIRYP